MSLRSVAVALLMLALAGGVRAVEAGADYQALIETLTLSRAPNTASWDSGAMQAAKAEALEKAVVLRSATDGTNRTLALITVHRDVAAALAAKQQWLNAAMHLENAVTLARTLEEPDLMVAILLQAAGYYQQADASAAALLRLDAADEIIRPLGRRAAQVESSLLRAKLLSSTHEQCEKGDAIYEELLADPEADRFRIELHRARSTRFDRPPQFIERWTRVLELTRTGANAAVQSEAFDQLGLAIETQDPARAAKYFSAAEETGAPLIRSGPTWIAVIKTYNRMDHRDRIRRALTAAAAVIDEKKDPSRAADLHEATADLLGREGDFAAAYRELRLATDLRQRRNALRQSMPFTSLTPQVTPRQTATAAELAAVRSALREAELERTKLLQRQTAARKALGEAELERTRLLQRQTAGIATVAVLLASLLGLAYAYKRRSAASLAVARDNAELRADRTHWQMLRYQLNPHFLFNALSSLGGLVATDPRAAGRVVDRLSEFCQLALKGSSEDLRTLDHELQIIRAYLDVEQAGHGDSLTVRLDVTPAARSCLVPPLLLQPLVENALKYGGETSDDHLEIAILARRSTDGASLELEVLNTGRWVERPDASRPREAVGLANVRERLARFGGEAAALTFAHDGHCVRAQLRLPAREAAPGSPAP